jgi:eukaryotic-like serine/threonine-protein kinase
MIVRAHDPKWTAAERYLDQALELEPQQQEAWLAELDGTHPAIARTVRGLLAERDALNAAGFMSDSLFSSPQDLALAVRAIVSEQALALKPGAIVGPYRLLHEIGHGGMSSVWLAERSDGQLKREVALKLPYIGPRMHVESFLRERDMLAALTHPQIARLYDAGISEAGQPYLAMEYVEGTVLLRHCDERHLTIGERLRLFLQVLEAMQFAHARLIIHRDLKPSNILVTPQGRVTLLDFGIGKLLTDGAAHATHLTQAPGRALTPDYASPEQIAGESLGAASDIYSLGVIVYELLTGSRPYRLKRESQAALEEAILTEDLRRPSQAEFSAESATARGTSVRALARALAGDLDIIVLKALKRNPCERYASVTAFAQDISNHLHSLPVSARPDSYWYRVGRFVTRHKIPVIAASASLLAVLSGAGIAIWNARAAAMERDLAVAFAERNDAVTDFLGAVIREAAASPTPVNVSEMLMRSEQLALEDTGDSPENRAAVLSLLSDQYFALGNSKRTAELTQRALALLASSPDRALRSRLVCNHALARSELGYSSEAVASILRELRGLDSDPETASICLLNLTEICWVSRTPEEALRYAREGLERYQQVPRPRGNLGPMLLEMVAYSYHMNGHNSEANAYFEQALEKYRESGTDRRPPAVVLRGNWALAIAKAGMPRRALQLYDEMFRIEAHRDPSVRVSLSRTVLGSRGRALAAVGRFAEARVAVEEACRVSEQQDEPMGRLQCAIDLAYLAVETGALAQASEQLQRADQLINLDLAPSSPLMLRRSEIEGRLELASGHYTHARTLFDRVLATKVISPWRFSAELGKAEIELATGHSAAAIREARQALQTASAIQGSLPYSNQTGLAALMLGRALQSQGDRARAQQALQTAITHLSNTVDANHPELARAQRLLSGLSL